MKAIEILKCKECHDTKPYYGLSTSFSCANCRCVDSCESVLVCGKCTEHEVKDDNLCPECQAGYYEHLHDLITNR